MVYIILAANLLVFGLVVVFIFRFVRSGPESRRAALLPTRKHILIAASVFGILIVGTLAVLMFTFGVAGFRVSTAAKQHLEALYGPALSWSVQLSDHVVRSEEPKSGLYQISYRYGTKSGVMEAAYEEINGQFIVQFAEKEK